MVFTENKNRKKTIPIIKYSSVICLFYCLLNVGAVLSAKNTFQEQKQKLDDLKYQTQTTISPTKTPTLTSTPKKTVNTNTNNSGNIDCIGPDGKQFKTTMVECKALNEKWGKSVDYMTTCNIPAECGGGSKYVKYSECMKPCTRINTNNTQQNNYPTLGPVKINCSYHNGNYNFDYGMLTYNECKIKSDAYWTSKRVAIPTIQIVPTSIPITQAPVVDQAKCNEAVRMWSEYKADFYATRYPNYSSSAEAIMALEAERQYIQNVIYFYGCSNVISL